MHDGREDPAATGEGRPAVQWREDQRETGRAGRLSNTTGRPPPHQAETLTSNPFLQKSMSKLVAQGVDRGFEPAAAWEAIGNGQLTVDEAISWILNCHPDQNQTGTMRNPPRPTGTDPRKAQDMYGGYSILMPEQQRWQRTDEELAQLRDTVGTLAKNSNPGQPVGFSTPAPERSRSSRQDTFYSQGKLYRVRDKESRRTTPSGVSMRGLRPSRIDADEVSSSEDTDEDLRGRSPGNEKVSPYSGDDNFDAWMTQFQAVATDCGWSRRKQRRRLTNALTGQAREYYYAIPHEAKRSLSRLVGELHAAYGASKSLQHYQQELNNVRQRYGEALHAYRARVVLLSAYAYPAGQEGDSIVKSVVLNAFLKGLLTREHETMVRALDPQDINEATNIISRFDTGPTVQTQSRPPPRPGFGFSRPAYQPVRPNQPSPTTQIRQLVEEQPEVPGLDPAEDEEDTALLIAAVRRSLAEMTCFNCSEKGHLRRDCPKGRRTPGNRRATGEEECYRCHKKGHFARECPEEEQPAEAVRQIVLRAAETGPSPQFQMTVSGVEVTALYDTGAQVCVLQPAVYERLPTHYKRVREQVSLRGATQATMKGLALRNVPIKIGSVECHWDFVVADIAEMCIIGYDLIRHLGLKLDLQGEEGTGTKEQQVTGRSTAPENNIRVAKAELSTLVLQKAQKIPPRTARMLNAKICDPPSRSAGEVFLVEATDPFRQLLQPRYITDSTHPVYSCHNVSDRTLKIPANVPLATVTVVQAMESSRRDSTQPGGATADSQEAEGCDSDGGEDVFHDALDSVYPSDVGTPPPTAELNTVSTAPAPETPAPDEPAAQLPAHLRDLYARSCSQVPEIHHPEIAKLLMDNRDVFAENDYDIGHFKGLQHHIETGEARPVRCGLRRTPLGYEEVERKLIGEMLKAKVIRPSHSEYASAPVLVKKRDGTIRYAIDYRPLNAATAGDSYPLPNMDGCLEACSGGRYFSTLDFNNAYWNVELAPDAIPKSAFITRLGTYEWLRMPFGLKCAPQTFSRAMHLVLDGLLHHEVTAYLDDVVCIGKDFAGAKRSVLLAMERFRAHGLKLKARKCNLFQKEIQFLGRRISEDGISIDPAGLDTLEKWAVPQSVRQVESYLGWMNYHRAYIPHFASVAAPLYELTGAKAVFRWEEKHQKAFEELKKILGKAPTLAFPLKDRPFVLDVDASLTACGGALYQATGNGPHRLIAFGSFSFTPAQRRYCTTRRELLALLRSLRHFRHYLIGCPFTVRTDHASLVWLAGFKYPSGQLARWLEELSQYDFKMTHRKGKDHTNADALSRIPDEMAFCEAYQAGVELACLPCGGCRYCERAHREWARFERDVDEVIPLSKLPLRVRRLHWTPPTQQPPTDLENWTHDLYLLAEEEAIDVNLEIDVCGEGRVDPSSETITDGGSGSHHDAYPVQVEAVASEQAKEQRTGPTTDLTDRHHPEGTCKPLTSTEFLGHSAGDLRIAQRGDPDLALLITWLEKKHEPTQGELYSQSPAVKKYWLLRENLELRDGLLYYLWMTDTGVQVRYMVPRSQRNEVLKACHDTDLAGHPAENNLTERVRRKFEWFQLARDCRDHTATCHACAVSKHGRRQRAPLRQYHAGVRFEKVHLDVLGPFSPPTEQGNIYILIMTDQFSKWIEVAALKDQTSETVSQAFIDCWLSRWGSPLEVLTDQGSNFMAETFAQVLQAYGVHQLRTVAYHANANGQAERYCGRVAQILRCTALSDPKNWDVKLQLAAGAIRAHSNRMTGFTPNRMVTGDEARQPIDILFSPQREPRRPTPDYVTSLQEGLEEVHDVARKQLQTNVAYSNRNHDLRAHAQAYEVGDYVYLRRKAKVVGQSKKLLPLYEGPYVIIDRRGPVLYKIHTRRAAFWTHHDRLRRCRLEQVPRWLEDKRKEVRPPTSTNPEDDSESGEEEEPYGLDDLFAPEKLWCHCRQPDAGVMIECSSSSCPYLWFHLPCVGLKKGVKGKWYCPTCSA